MNSIVLVSPISSWVVWVWLVESFVDLMIIIAELARRFPVFWIVASRRKDDSLFFKARTRFIVISFSTIFFAPSCPWRIPSVFLF